MFNEYNFEKKLKYIISKNENDKSNTILGIF